jgi:rhodanese-related sulfurtransferase
VAYEKKAKDLAEKNGDFVLIDVREKDEIAEDGGANTDHGGGG